MPDDGDSGGCLFTGDDTSVIGFVTNNNAVVAAAVTASVRRRTTNADDDAPVSRRSHRQMAPPFHRATDSARSAPRAMIFPRIRS